MSLGNYWKYLYLLLILYSLSHNHYIWAIHQIQFAEFDRFGAVVELGLVGCSDLDGLGSSLVGFLVIVMVSFLFPI